MPSVGFFHVAALKQVPFCEIFSVDAVKINVIFEPILVLDYVDENVSDKVAKLIQSYTGGK